MLRRLSPIILFLVLLIFTSLFVVDAQTSSSYTVMKGWNDKESFYWPNIQANKAERNSSDPKIPSTLPHRLKLINSVNIEVVRIETPLINLVDSSPSNKTTFTIENCRIGKLYLGRSLTNVEINVINSEIGQVASGSTQYGPIIFEKTNINFINNTFSDAILLSLNRDSVLWTGGGPEGQPYNTGIYFVGYTPSFNQRLRQVAFGNDTNVKIADNRISLTGALPTNGGSQISFSGVRIWGYTGNISIRSNRIVIANNTDQIVIPILLSQFQFDPPVLIARKQSFDALEYRYAIDAEYAQGLPASTGSRAWDVTDNYINVTSSFAGKVTSSETLDLRFVGVQLRSLRNVGRIDISRNIFVFRSDPRFLLVNDAVKGVNLGDFQRGDVTGCRVQNITDGIFVDSNVVVVEATPPWFELWPNKWELKDESDYVHRNFADLYSNWASDFKKADFWARQGVPMLYLFSVTRIYSLTCPGMWSDVGQISMSNNSLGSEVRTQHFSGSEIEIDGCSAGLSLINVSFNRYANLTVSGRAHVFKISKYHLKNTVVVVNNNYLHAPDPYKLCWNLIGVAIQQDGAGTDCARRQVNNSNFFAYGDNQSIYSNNNFFNVSSQGHMVPMNMEDEDFTASLGDALAKLPPFPRKGRLNIIQYKNNTMYITQDWAKAPVVSNVDTTDAGAEGLTSCYGIGYFTSGRNVSLIDISDNYIVMHATTGHAVAGISIQWPGYRESGVTSIRNNSIRMYGVYSIQPSYTVAGIIRNTYSPESDIGPTYYLDNDIEMHIGPQGCSTFQCVGIGYVFGEVARTTDEIVFRGNRVVIVAGSLENGNGVAGLSLLSSVVMSGIPVGPSTMQTEEFIFNRSSLLVDLKGVKVTDNFINISASWRVTGFQFIVAGEMQYTTQSNTYCDVEFSGNEVHIDSRQTFSNLNAAILLSHFLSSFKFILSGGFEFPLIFSSIRGSTMLLQNFSIKNSAFFLQGGVPSVLTVGSLVKLYAAKSGGGGGLRFENVSVVNRVTTSQTTDQSKFPANSYSEPSDPAGYCRGLFNLLPEDTARRPLNKIELIVMENSNNNKQEQERSRPILEFKNVSVDLQGMTADTTVFYWPANSNNNYLVPSDQQQRVSAAKEFVSVSISGSTWKIRSPTPSSTVKDDVSSVAPTLSLSLTSTTTKASVLFFGIRSSYQPQFATAPNVETTFGIRDSVFELELSSSSSSPPSNANPPTMFSFVEESSDRQQIVRRRRTNLDISRSNFSLTRPSSMTNNNNNNGNEVINSNPIIFLVDRSTLGEFSFSESTFSVEHDENDRSDINLRVPSAVVADGGGTVWSLLILAKTAAAAATASAGRTLVNSIRFTNSSLLLPVAVSQSFKLLPQLSPSSSSPQQDLFFSCRCLKLNGISVRRASSIFSTISSVAGAGSEISPCQESLTKSVSVTSSRVPLCARYGLLYVTDKEQKVIESAGKAIQVRVGLIVGSELLPLTTYPPTPKRIVPQTPPPAGQDQSEAFTVFRQGFNTSTSNLPLVRSTNPATAHVIWAYTHISESPRTAGRNAAHRPNTMTLLLHIPPGLSSDKDHQVEIAVSPSLLMCVTPPYVAAPTNESNGFASSSSSSSSWVPPPPIYYEESTGWPIVRFTLSKRRRGSGSDDGSSVAILMESMKQVGTGAAFASTFMSRNAAILAQMNRVDTLDKFIDCGFSDNEPVDPMQSPIQIFVGDADKPGYYHRAAVLGNLLVTLLVVAGLSCVALVNWKKRQKSYERKLNAYRLNTLRGSNNMKDTKSLGTKSVAEPPQPPLSFRECLHASSLPSHILVPLLGLLQGLVASSVAMVRVQKFSGGNDNWLAALVFIITGAYFSWMCYIVFYTLPRHAYVAYVPRKDEKSSNVSHNQHQQGERRQTLGPSKWFPKCPQCNNGSSLLDQGNEQQKQKLEQHRKKKQQQSSTSFSSLRSSASKTTEENDDDDGDDAYDVVDQVAVHSANQRPMLRRIKMERFALYRFMKWLLTPLGDWVMFKAPLSFKKTATNDNSDNSDCCAFLPTDDEEGKKKKRNHRPFSRASSPPDDDDEHEQQQQEHELEMMMVTSSASGSQRRLFKGARSGRGDKLKLQPDQHQHQQQKQHPSPRVVVPDRFFRERTDKVLDDYTHDGRHGALIEFVVAFATAVAAGLTPQQDVGGGGGDGCANAASFVLVINALPFAYLIAVVPMRKKTTFAFAVVTGAILTFMSFVVGLSKLVELQILLSLMNFIQLSMDFAVTVKLALDMIEIFWLFEIEAMLIPLYWMRHYLYHFDSTWEGLRTLFRGKKYQNHQNQQLQQQQQLKRSSNFVGVEDDVVIIMKSKLDDGAQQVEALDGDGDGEDADWRKYVKTRRAQDSHCWDVAFDECSHHHRNRGGGGRRRTSSASPNNIRK